ncbi:hypothetical protein COR50_07270 [Chitinophaga caeni]|uniref:Uncharacterized protein n=1 Tax=Chitinophaga caeni TaxID=2029983 RepID=A0A291QSR0_9BACT|nr:hypothetical protein [Chitinophaga caeni]ATL47000.1 hypothetical protein COR50_07270 [Chitinophaga caeni]
MAVARFRNEFIASSNVKDIKDYCELYGIVYFTTMDILEVAITNSIMTESQCDSFIYEVKQKGSKLPCDTMAAYRKRNEKWVSLQLLNRYMSRNFINTFSTPGFSPCY